MRDPNRISPTLAVIADYWRQVPDWRLGQLIANVLETTDKDIFYMEDSELLSLFEKYFNTFTEKTSEGK